MGLVAGALDEAGIAYGLASRRGLEADVSVVPVELAKGLGWTGSSWSSRLGSWPRSARASEPSTSRSSTRATRRLAIVHADPLPEALVDADSS